MKFTLKIILLLVVLLNLSLGLAKKRNTKTNTRLNKFMAKFKKSHHHSKEVSEEDLLNPYVISRLQFIVDKKPLTFDCKEHFGSTFESIEFLADGSVKEKNFNFNYGYTGKDIILCYEKIRLQDLPAGKFPINAFEIVRVFNKCYTEGFTIMSQNLNAGKAGTDLWLCYGYDPKQPLSNRLFGVLDNNGVMTKENEKELLNNKKNSYCLHPSTNDGAAGYFFYLCVEKPKVELRVKSIEILSSQFKYNESKTIIPKQDLTVQKLEQQNEFYNNIIVINNGDSDSEVEVEEEIGKENSTENESTRDLSAKASIKGKAFGVGIAAEFKAGYGTGISTKQTESKTKNTNYSCSAKAGKSVKCYSEKKVLTQTVPFVTKRRITLFDGQTRDFNKTQEIEVFNTKTEMNTQIIELKKKGTDKQLDCYNALGYDKIVKSTDDQIHNKIEKLAPEYDFEVLTDVIIIQATRDDQCPVGYIEEKEKRKEEHLSNLNFLICYQKTKLSEVNSPEDIINTVYLSNITDNATCPKGFKLGKLRKYNHDLDSKILCIGNNGIRGPVTKFKLKLQSETDTTDVKSKGYTCEVFNPDTNQARYNFCTKTDPKVPKTVEIKDFEIQEAKVISRTEPKEVEVVTVKNSKVKKTTKISQSTEEKKSTTYSFGAAVSVSFGMKMIITAKMGFSMGIDTKSKETKSNKSSITQTIKHTCNSQNNRPVQCRLFTTKDTLLVNYKATKNYIDYDGNPLNKTPDEFSGSTIRESTSIVQVNCCNGNTELCGEFITC